MRGPRAQAGPFLAHPRTSTAAPPSLGSQAWKGKKLKGVALKASSGGVTKKKGKARGSGKDVAMQGDN